MVFYGTIQKATGLEKHGIREDILQQTTIEKSGFSFGKALALSFFLQAASLLISLLFLDPTFRANDDLILHMLTSGAYGDHSVYTGFASVPLSSLLVALQRALPAFNHLAVLEYLFLFLSFTGVSTVVLSFWKNKKMSLLLAIATALVAPAFYTELHYTISAALFSAAGLLLLITSFDAPSRGGQQAEVWFYRVLGVALVWVGANLRFMAFFIGAAFVFPFGVALLLSHRPLQKKITLTLFFAAALALVVGGDFYSQYRYEKDPTTKGWLAYNQARQTISDYGLPPYEEGEAQYLAKGYTRNDMDVIWNWNYADRVLYPADKIIDLATLRQPRTLLDAAKYLWRYVLSYLIIDALFVPSLLGCAMLLLFAGKKEKLFSLSLLVISGAGLFFLAYIGRVTPWVMRGMGASLFFALVYAAKNLAFRKKGYFMATAALLALSVLVADARVLKRHHAPYGTATNPFLTSMVRQMNEDNNTLYLMAQLGWLGPNLSSPLSSIAPNSWDNIYIPGGWDSFLPAKEAPLRRFGIEGSVYEAWSLRPDVLLVDSENYKYTFQLVRQRFDQNARLSLVGTLNGQYVWACTRGVPGGAGAAETLALTATGSGPSEVRGDFYNLNAKISYPADFKAESKIFYSVLTDANGKETAYRAAAPHIISPTQCAVIATVPIEDLKLQGAYTLRVVTVDKDKAFTSDKASLVWG